MRKFIGVLAIVIVMSMVLFGSALAITNSQPDGNDHPYVSLITDGTNICTGTAVDGTTLVTAAHCFSEVGQVVLVTFNGEEPYSFIPGVWYPHPEFCPLCGSGLEGTDTHDIAVVKLFAEISLPEFASLPEVGFVDTLKMKSPVSIVGYGIRGWVKGGGVDPWTVPVFDGNRYAAMSSLIKSKHVNHAEYIKLSANPSKGKGGTCFGDSGGPNLYGDDNILIAINTFNNNTNCAGITYSNRIDLDYALAFIQSFMGE